MHAQFLPVGHTHEAVDQMFSCWSKALARQNVTTLKDLGAILKESYHKKTAKQLSIPSMVNVHHLEELHDFVKALEPFYVVSLC